MIIVDYNLITTIYSTYTHTQIYAHTQTYLNLDMFVCVCVSNVVDYMYMLVYLVVQLCSALLPHGL